MAQNVQSILKEKVATYLTRYLAEFNNREHSLHNQFYGELIPIQDALKAKLTETFSKHDFVIARTMYTHWVPNDGSANILLIVDKEKGEVVAHQWAMWFSGASETFYQVLDRYPAKSKEDALNKIKVFSELIVFSTPNGNVGTSKLSKNKIELELKRGNDVWRVLQVPID